MRTFPQNGGCLCGDVRYTVTEDPVTLYACHCTDCQRETGAAFTLSAVVRSEALVLTSGAPREFSCELSDGRTKSASYCPRCITKLWGRSTTTGLANLDVGTLDDTSWVAPAGHIWTRSAQSWLTLPEGSLAFEAAPGEAGVLALVRAWKAELGSTGT